MPYKRRQCGSSNINIANGPLCVQSSKLGSQFSGPMFSYTMRGNGQSSIEQGIGAPLIFQNRFYPQEGDKKTEEKSLSRTKRLVSIQRRSVLDYPVRSLTLTSEMRPELLKSIFRWRDLHGSPNPTLMSLNIETSLFCCQRGALRARGRGMP